jgi:hypothetical protein
LWRSSCAEIKRSRHYPVRLVADGPATAVKYLLPGQDLLKRPTDAKDSRNSARQQVSESFLNAPNQPLTQLSSAFDAPFVCERAELQNYGCLTTSSVQHRLQPLRPGLRDLSTIGLEQEVLHEDGSPCVPEMSGVGIRPNSCRVYTPPRDIPKLDYGFPISGFDRA